VARLLPHLCSHGACPSAAGAQAACSSHFTLLHMSLVQSTPEELEYLCKCLSVDAEELAASAAALIENLGALPPKCEARLYWRSLVKEATFNLTDVDETVVALLNRLDNVAAAAGVDAPDNALLVGVRRLRRFVGTTGPAGWSCRLAAGRALSWDAQPLLALAC
jgi:hypothetical protein